MYCSRLLFKLQFVGMDDSICKEGDVPHPDFSPKAIGMTHADDRPITMSGNGF